MKFVTPPAATPGYSITSSASQHRMELLLQNCIPLRMLTELSAMKSSWSLVHPRFIPEASQVNLYGAPRFGFTALEMARDDTMSGIRAGKVKKQRKEQSNIR